MLALLSFSLPPALLCLVSHLIPVTQKTDIAFDFSSVKKRHCICVCQYELHTEVRGHLVCPRDAAQVPSLMPSTTEPSRCLGTFSPGRQRAEAKEERDSLKSRMTRTLTPGSISLLLFYCCDGNMARATHRRRGWLRN